MSAERRRASQPNHLRRMLLGLLGSRSCHRNGRNRTDATPARRSTNATILVTALAFLASLVALVPGAMAATEVKPYRATLLPASQPHRVRAHPDALQRRRDAATRLGRSLRSGRSHDHERRHEREVREWRGDVRRGDLRRQDPTAQPRDRPGHEQDAEPRLPLHRDGRVQRGTKAWGVRAKQANNFSGLVWQRLQAQHDDGFAAHQPDDHVPDRLV